MLETVSVLARASSSSVTGPAFSRSISSRTAARIGSTFSTGAEKVTPNTPFMKLGVQE